MALYFYKALSKDGRHITGYFDAPSEEGVKSHLVARGVFPVAITAATQESRQSWWRRLFTRSISVKDKILFTRQLSVLLRSGIPLLQAFELLSEQFEGPLRTILVGVKDDIKSGVALADALNKYPKTFDTIYVQLVRAGEASGKLDTILERLTNYLERRDRLQKKIKGALRYPIIQLVIVFLVLFALMWGIVPMMAGVFKAQKQDLPGVTKVLIRISEFFTNYIFSIVIGGLILFFGFRYWARTVSGARKLDRLKLKLPLVGYFTRMSAVVQFSYTLGILLEGGVNLAEALDIVCRIIDNRILVDQLKDARDKIVKQGKIAQYLKQTGIFPPIASYMITTGEQSGELDQMLLTVAQNYEEDLSEFTDTLTESLSPILLLVMTIVVGFIILAIILPIVQMSQSAEGIAGV